MATAMESASSHVSKAQPIWLPRASRTGRHTHQTRPTQRSTICHPSALCSFLATLLRPRLHGLCSLMGLLLRHVSNAFSSILIKPFSLDFGPVRRTPSQSRYHVLRHVPPILMVRVPDLQDLEVRPDVKVAYLVPLLRQQR